MMRGGGYLVLGTGYLVPSTKYSSVAPSKRCRPERRGHSGISSLTARPASGCQPRGRRRENASDPVNTVVLSAAKDPHVQVLRCAQDDNAGYAARAPPHGRERCVKPPTLAISRRTDPRRCTAF